MLFAAVMHRLCDLPDPTDTLRARTAQIYAWVSLVTGILLHQYLVHRHMGGRVMDAWRRLNGREEDFFVPHDLEVSAAELRYACQRARRWRGPNGGRREVIVHEFQGEEEHLGGKTPMASGSGPSSSSSSNNKNDNKRNGSAPRLVAIYDVETDGKRSLHRQFLRSPGGTIQEMTGDVWKEIGWRPGQSADMPRRLEPGRPTDNPQGNKGIFAGLLPLTTAEAGPSSVDGGAESGDTRGGEGVLGER